MKLAVFDHQLNNGGGKRFLQNLLFSLSHIEPSLEITLFCNYRQAEAALNLEEFRSHRISVRSLQSLEATDAVINYSFFSRLDRYILRRLKLTRIKKEIEKKDLSAEITHLSQGYDVAYFPWPYLLQCPQTYCKKVVTFHDFNFQYFFGLPIYSRDQANELNESFSKWMKEATAVVSTHFMKNELRKFYPHHGDINVIHLASLNRYKRDPSPKIVEQAPFVSDTPYILFPVHMTVHKNIGNVIAATSIVNKDEIRFTLVLTGQHTENIQGRSGYYGMQHNTAERDVQGLGYVSDEEMLILQQNAFAVMNASFYEAGNGVGLDAWPIGIPVLQSNIPAFNEHLEHQHFRAFSFDPRNAQSIASAIEECLQNAEQRKKNVSDSLKASANVTWEITAAKYLEVFKSLS